MDRHDEHLLGYYRNGALVATEEEAIPVALTGVLQEQEWSIPAPPAELPRLGCFGCNCAGFRQDGPPGSR